MVQSHGLLPTNYIYYIYIYIQKKSKHAVSEESEVFSKEEAGKLCALT